MKSIARKSPLVRAIDLRDRRRRAGISTNEFAGILKLADAKQISAMEIGICSITLERAIRASYRLGGVVVELEDFGYAVVAPLKDFKTDDAPHVAEGPEELRAGEAAWISIRENREAQEAIQRLQDAILEGKRETLVELYDEVICDTNHANSILAKSIQAIDPTIKDEAEAKHSKHFISGKARQRVIGPLSPSAA